MARKKPVNPDQFQMFYSANELKHSLTDSGDRRDIKGRINAEGGIHWDRESMPDMWSRKLDEAKQPSSTGDHGSGVYDSIQSEGLRPHFTAPIYHQSGGGTQLEDGHHRVAAAADVETKTGKTQWIPASHYDAGTQRAFRGERPTTPYTPPEPRVLRTGDQDPTEPRSLNTNERAAVDSLLKRMF